MKQESSLPKSFDKPAGMIGALTGLITAGTGLAVLEFLNTNSAIVAFGLLGLPFGLGLPFLAVSQWKMRPVLTVLFPVLMPLIYVAGVFAGLIVLKGTIFLSGFLGGAVAGLVATLMVAMVFRPARTRADSLWVTLAGAGAGAVLAPLVDPLPYVLVMGWHAVVLGVLNGRLAGTVQ